jgi:SAM-dependent methyltransferase
LRLWRRGWRRWSCERTTLSNNSREKPRRQDGRLRELGFDAYGFDIHDYVAYRSDDDRQWFRFSRSTSRDTSAFTIDADRYAIPFEADFFDIVHSTSVIEHVLDIRPVMSECARVLRPDCVAIHFYPPKYQVVEPHMYVPLASFVQRKAWLRLWVVLGARNEFHGENTVGEVTDAYKQYTITGLRYRTRKELLYAAGGVLLWRPFPTPSGHALRRQCLDSDSTNDEGVENAGRLPSAGSLRSAVRYGLRPQEVHYLTVAGARRPPAPHGLL